ncbi:hypothetical protein MLD38_009589 [Melastoma candidum]|uniref:Uncharacterized protein n=1 Tax=Melastoma candidum TaxID=119954 RepID=A0ACB9RY20_9MYRT|nr:hypothetical protein MLD38_009589 [Melastoma candidum]
MVRLWFLIAWVCSSSLSRTSVAQQLYDTKPCFSNSSYPGSRYTCESPSNSTCPAFLVYRARLHNQTAADISDLFGADVAKVRGLNNLSSAFESLELGREVIVPITCSCSGGYFSADLSYVVQDLTNFSEVACDVFEGLVESLTLLEDNPAYGSTVLGRSKLSVPIKCACPGNSSGTANTATYYYLTYALKEGDNTNTVAQKFRVPVTEIWAANHLDYRSTVYTKTTILIPLSQLPHIGLVSLPSPPPSPVFLPTVPTEKSSEDTKLRNLSIMASTIGFVLILIVFISCGLYLRALSRWRSSQGKTKIEMESFNMRSSVVSCLSQRSTPRSGRTRLSSRNSCLSPDLLAGIKYSLNKYTVGELRNATRGFGDNSKIEREVYKGWLDDTEVIIKGCRSDEAQQVIDLHSNINHTNILSLIGACYDEADDAWAPSYVVYNRPSNGCLRELLSDPESTIDWKQRKQIAFDIATGLHYLHHCIFPSHIHTNVSTKNIFVTANWRAKLADVAATSMNQKEDSSLGPLAAPEYVTHGTISEKVDVFAFGVVLLELISARGDRGREQFEESIAFLAGGGNEGGCFEKLKGFVDPCLKDDYPLAEALCLAVLAKACVGDEPQQRPSMDDVIKVLARMV